MRYYLVDRVEEICYGKFITGVKCVTLADDVFDEHFPGYPIFPGSLMMEGMAQLAGSFFEIMMKEQDLPLRQSILSIVNKLKFKKPAEPGDRILYRADIVAMRDDFGVAKVSAEIDGATSATGELTFIFVDINDEKLHNSRKEIYEICMKNTRVIKE
ncbi:MAG: 3-hydroxyacyl-[acyl-carrier-protein] dehydratase FabZ [bacterium]|nr:3-hydroxyacyl-[acyl-carrier-protein] dehydratase FabZ [bacterium]